MRIHLPDGSAIPAAYHLTEVGQVSKVFIDCGGKVHSELRCVLQTWIGPDKDHRLDAARSADILDLGRAVVAADEMEVEFEHGQVYPVGGWCLEGENLVLIDLASKATDCLARELCGADCCGDGKHADAEPACCA